MVNGHYTNICTLQGLIIHTNTVYTSTYLVYNLTHTHKANENSWLSVSAANNVFDSTPPIFTKPSVSAVSLKVKTPQNVSEDHQLE